MDSSQNNETEYKRSFVWSKPMVEMPPPKVELPISNYQISYGGGGQLTAKPTVSSGSKSLDHLDHSKSVSSAESRSPTPGMAKTLRSQEVAAGLASGSSGSKEHQNFHKHGPLPIGPSSVAEQVGGGAGVLFSYELPPRSLSPIDLSKQSEYHAKFKPFDEYVYVEGEGKFKKQTAATKLIAASTANGAAIYGDASPPSSASKAWFVEVEERCKQACKYRARSQNGQYFAVFKFFIIVYF